MCRYDAVNEYITDLVVKMVRTLTESKQYITDEEILSVNTWLAGPIHESFIYTGYLGGPNILLVLNLDLVDLVLLEITSSE